VSPREQNSAFKLYEQETGAAPGPGARLFQIAALTSFLIFGAAGVYLKTHNPPPQVIEERVKRVRQVSFVMEAPKKEVAPIPVKKTEPIVKKELVKERPVDLTKNPVLAQKEDDVKPVQSLEKPPEEPVRRVYGLRKVYATGIGAGSDGSEAIIGKQGNTLNTDIDTIKALAKDLEGSVVPITTVTTAPILKNAVKPEYTTEMIEAKVEGLVNAQLLIDATGHVIDVKILNDLGYSTRDRAREAFLKWIFEPALRGNEPVSVWITYAIRFVLLDY
jgi:TonB family protein